MTRSRIVLVVTIVVISAFLYLMIRHKRLGNYLGLVERTFADEIALIEQKCIEHPTEYDETRFDWIDETEALCNQELSDPAIYWASCSYDGHHGITSFKSPAPGSGMSCPQWLLHSNADGSRSLGFGTTKNGKPLLVLHGYNPDALKRRYIVAFFRDVVVANAE